MKVLVLVKRLIVARRPALVDVAALALALALATALRKAIDGGAYGFPFLTFFPLILLSAVFQGGRYAVIAAVASALIVSRLLMPTPWLAEASSAQFVIAGLFALATLFIIGIGQVLRSLVRENEAHIQQQAAFNAELQHRTKNALQIMRALIARGPRGEDPALYFQTLAGRLDALAKANELLRFGALQSADMRELTQAAVAPFDAARFQIEGPQCRAGRDAVTPLMMALHELCTNATKYGALSTDDGRVSLTWKLGENGTAPIIRILWAESGGPPVSPPTHRGLGTRLLAPHGGLSAVDLDWREEGLECRMVAPGVD